MDGARAAVVTCLGCPRHDVCGCSSFFFPQRDFQSRTVKAAEVGAFFWLKTIN